MIQQIKKGNYVIDSTELASNYSVVDPYSCTLNQTDITHNNNKFYIVQLLQHDTNKDDYLLWQHWGRIGDKGQSKNTKFSQQDFGIPAFEKTFSTKTGNPWFKRDNFVQKSGKYHLTIINYDDATDPVDKTDYSLPVPKLGTPKRSPVRRDKKNPEPSAVQLPASSLDDAVQKFVSLISNVQMFNQTMTSFNVDITKMPLGKIDKAQIQDASKVIQKIASVLSTSLASNQDLTSLSNEFYTLIPTSFGRRRPPLINNEEVLKKYADMLGVLADIQIAGNLLNDGSGTDIHPCDKIYRQLNIDLAVLPVSGHEAQVLTNYVTKTQGFTHTSYRLEVMDILKVYRKEEHDHFKDYGNKHLLFHGSRVANFMGILSQGLRTNPNAVVTGKMFGNGIYFANCVTKSANYCFTDRENNTGVLLLCEVALGKPYRCHGSKNVTWLPNDEYQSTWGIGRNTPNPGDTIMDDDLKIPYGLLGVTTDPQAHLVYDEFIVYREDQIKIRYAIKMKFNYT